MVEILSWFGAAKGGEADENYPDSDARRTLSSGH
jgi:hypothetical protein